MAYARGSDPVLEWDLVLVSSGLQYLQEVIHPMYNDVIDQPLLSQVTLVVACYNFS